MTPHLTDEQIAGVALGDDDAQSPGVAVHLEGCGRCRAELRAVQDALAAAAALEVPARGDDYGARVWAALDPRLPSPSAASSGPRVWPGWLAVAAALLAVAGAFVAGRSSRPAVAPGAAVATLAPEAVRERVVLAALGDHLARTERALVELVNQSGNGRVDIAAEQAWARDLLEANRLYRRSVREAASPALSELLDDLEPVLLEIANSPSELSAEEFVALRDRIEQRSLVFKVRATGADIRARERRLIRQGVSQS